jgi:iron complex outermembrane receptor protein
LWDAGVSFHLPLKDQTIEINCQVQNVFNTAYLAHLSRYRIINVPEQGRNVVVSAKMLFGGQFKN